MNGISANSDIELPIPCRIEYYQPRFDFQNPHSFFPRFDRRWVIYEDADIIAVFKPLEATINAGQGADPYFTKALPPGLSWDGMLRAPALTSRHVHLRSIGSE